MASGADGDESPWQTRTKHCKRQHLCSNADAPGQGCGGHVYTLQLHEEETLRSSLGNQFGDSKPETPIRSARDILCAAAEKVNPAFLTATNPTTGEADGCGQSGRFVCGGEKPSGFWNGMRTLAKRYGFSAP